MKIDKFNWSLLYTFLIIVNEKSISLAAIRLNITQSAVSQSLKRLEDHLEVKLIERNNKNFYLTEYGKALYKTTIDVYSKLTKFEQKLDATNSTITDTLDLIIVSGIVSDAFERLLAYFHKNYPNIHLNIRSFPNVEIVKRLINHFPAIGITLGTKNVGELDSLFYLPQRYSLYCGLHHPLYQKDIITKSDVISQDYAIFDSEQLGEALSPLAIFRDMAHFTGKVSATTNNLAELKRLIITGVGIGCLPDNAAEDDITNGKLRKLPPYQGVADIPLYIAWNKKRKLKPAEHAFIDAASIVSRPDQLNR